MAAVRSRDAKVKVLCESLLILKAFITIMRAVVGLWLALKTDWYINI